MAMMLAVRMIGIALFVRIFFCHGVLPLQDCRGGRPSYRESTLVIFGVVHYLSSLTHNATGEILTVVWGGFSFGKEDALEGTRIPACFWEVFRGRGLSNRERYRIRKGQIQKVRMKIQKKKLFLWRGMGLDSLRVLS